MGRFQSFDPNAELSGATAYAFLININHENIENILRSHHLANIDPERWYSLQSVLNVMSDISEGFDYSSNFVAIGLAAGELGIKMLPPGMGNLTVEQFLNDYEKTYLARHRNGDVGWVKTEKLDDSHFIVSARTPYPDDVVYGVFYAYVRWLTPPGKRFILRYDENAIRHDEGGEATIIHVTLS